MNITIGKFSLDLLVSETSDHLKDNNITLHGSRRDITAHALADAVLSYAVSYAVANGGATCNDVLGTFLHDDADDKDMLFASAIAEDPYGHYFALSNVLCDYFAIDDRDQILSCLETLPFKEYRKLNTELLAVVRAVADHIKYYY